MQLGLVEMQSGDNDYKGRKRNCWNLRKPGMAMKIEVRREGGRASALRAWTHGMIHGYSNMGVFQMYRPRQMAGPALSLGNSWDHVRGVIDPSFWRHY